MYLLNLKLCMLIEYYMNYLFIFLLLFSYTFLCAFLVWEHLKTTGAQDIFPVATCLVSRIICTSIVFTSMHVSSKTR
jgi:hypothetical protein